MIFDYEFHPDSYFRPRPGVARVVVKLKRLSPTGQEWLRRYNEAAWAGKLDHGAHWGGVQ